MRSSTAEQMSYTHHVAGSNPAASTMNFSPTVPIVDEVDLDTARKIFRGRKIYTLTVLTAMWAVAGILMVTVRPRMQDLYRDMGVKPTVNEQQAGYGLAGLMLVSAVGAIATFSNHWEEKQIGARVKVSDIPGKSAEPLILITLGVGVGLLIMYIIGPIYSLTAGV